VPTAPARPRQWYGTSCASSVSLVRCTAPRGHDSLADRNEILGDK
jgi:hypothetical protein